jgi:hypothetical protein
MWSITHSTTAEAGSISCSKHSVNAAAPKMYVFFAMGEAMGVHVHVPLLFQ